MEIKDLTVTDLVTYTLNRIMQMQRSQNLENRKSRLSQDKMEEAMPVKEFKIRRHVDINGVSIWLTANSEQDYVNKLLKLANNHQEPTVKGKHLFREYAQNWFEVFSKPNITYVTALTYERQLQNHIYPILGDMMLEDITPADVQKVFNQMGADKKKETKNKVKIVLSQIFKMAVDDDGFMAKNPLLSSSVRIKGAASTETPPYTVEQMRYLAAHLSDIQQATDRAWLALCLSLPLRPEEVLGIKWKDIEKENCILHVRSTVIHPTRNLPEFKPYTKTESSRRDLAFPKEVLNYLPPEDDPENFLIGGKTPLSYTQLRGLRKRIQKETNFSESITPRRFRTTVATDISAITHDIKLVQKMLGHSSPQMTLKHYDKGRNSSVDAASVIGSCYGLSGT